MYMEAKNKYSQILYNATSLLIVMLSAHEINFIPLTASGAKIHAKLPLFQSGLSYLPKLSFRCSLRVPRSPRRQGFSAVKLYCLMQSVNILTFYDASIGFSPGQYKGRSLYKRRSLYKLLNEGLNGVKALTANGYNVSQLTANG